MLIRKPKLQLLAALAAFLLLAVAVGCKGFFVNSPDSITISPDPVSFADVGNANAQQLSAQATFGTQTQDVTTATIWKSANACAVVPSTTQIGLMTPIGTGSSVTITATYNGVSDTVTATLPTGLTISPCGTAGKFSAGGPAVNFTAASGSTDVTSTTTWQSSNNTVVNFTNPASGTATFPGTGTAIITANDGTDSGKLQVTVQ